MTLAKIALSTPNARTEIISKGVVAMAIRKIGKYNADGYYDPTACDALNAVTEDELVVEQRVNFVIRVVKFIIRESGFELLNRIEIKDSKTGRCFK